MNSEQLSVLLRKLVSISKENEWIEFKTNNTNPEEIGKWISALSNTALLENQEYGFLVFGVSDDRKIIGTKQFIKTLTKGKEELEHWLIQRFSPKLDIKFYDFFEGELKVSIVKIPAAISQPLRFHHEAYIRIGSITRNLKEFPEKERKIWLSKNSQNFEEQIALEELTFTQVTTLLDWETYFELTQKPKPTSQENLIEILIKEKLVLRNFEQYNITNLGAILFAKDLNDFPRLYRKSIRVIAFKNNNRIQTEREFLGRKGYAYAFSKLIEFLDSLLPKSEAIEKAIRKELSLFPIIALRELIANSLIHQDFSISGSGPLIEIFQNRIEITNPGIPLIDTLRFIDHIPQSRNEKLAYLMRMLNICEERGSGIDKVIAYSELYQLPPPEFIQGPNYTRVILYAPQNLRKMEKRDKIRACYQHCVLKYVTGEKMTNASLRERFQIEENNYPIASRILSETIKSNLIKDADPNNKSKKHSRYVPFWV